MPRSRPKLPIFWNWIPKNIPDQLKCVGFQNSKGVLNHSTLLGKMFQIVKGPQFQNFTLKCCFYFDTVPQTLLRVYPKISKQFCFLNIFFNLRFLKAKNRQKNPNLFFPLTKNNVSHFGDLNKCKIFFYLEFPFVDYLEYEYTSPPRTKMLVFLVVVHLIIIAFNLKNLCPSMFAILFLLTPS